MKSGYDSYDGIWGNEYYDDEFECIADRSFTQKTFVSGDALVSIRPISPDEVPKHGQARFYENGTAAVPYEGQPYDPTTFKLVKASWDHEHCVVCQFAIGDQNTFWENPRRRILCDACYEHYVLGK